jgi:nanoRNase/pAp phosphatase (c-di-AMP/oligoRNAs hydrolase)
MKNLPNYQDFFNFIKKLEGSVLLVMHHQADPDALGSAIAMIHLLKNLNASIEVFIHNPNLSALSEKMLQFLDYDLPTTHLTNHVDLVILLDTTTIDKTLLISQPHIVVFDHHVIQKIPFDLLFDFRNPHFSSTSEIITLLIKEGKIQFNLLIAKSLIAGIIFDTRRFLYADNALFDNLQYLMKDFPTIYKEVLPLFTGSRSTPERIARIKAAQRMKRFTIDKSQILITQVSSFEAASARALIQLGGDMAFVLANRENETRLSIRASPDFIQISGISIGHDIIPALISQFGGTGGGHDGAAGYNYPRKLELRELQSFVLQKLKSLLIKDES